MSKSKKEVIKLVFKKNTKGVVVTTDDKIIYIQALLKFTDKVVIEITKK